MFDDIKSLIANVQAVQIGDALIDLGNLSTKLGNTYNALLRGEKFAVDDTQLDTASRTSRRAATPSPSSRRALLTKRRWTRRRSS